MKIFVIRHGETDANKKSIFQGWSDFPLNDFGRELARETGQGLKGVRFDICYSSPLCRALETAEIVLKNSGNEDCQIKEDDRLKELNCGIYEKREIVRKDGVIVDETLRNFFLNPSNMDAFVGGENVSMLKNRTQQFLDELIQKNYDTVLVSTHGCALRAMLNHLYEHPEDYWQGHAPYNCALSILQVTKGQVEIIEKDKIYYDSNLCVDRFASK